MEMMESELDNYLDKQKDYSYEMKTVRNSVEITMNYLGKMSSYPEKITCKFFAENGQKFCMINEHKKIYSNGIIKKFINDELISRYDDTRKKEFTNPKIRYYAKLLGLEEGKLDINDIKRAYRTKMRDYGLDVWQHKDIENPTVTAKYETQKIQEAYDFFMEQHNDKH